MHHFEPFHCFHKLRVLLPLPLRVFRFLFLFLFLFRGLPVFFPFHSHRLFLLCLLLHFSSRDFLNISFSLHPHTLCLWKYDKFWLTFFSGMFLFFFFFLLLLIIIIIIIIIIITIIISKKIPFCSLSPFLLCLSSSLFLSLFLLVGFQPSFIVLFLSFFVLFPFPPCFSRLSSSLLVFSLFSSLVSRSSYLFCEFRSSSQQRVGVEEECVKNILLSSLLAIFPFFVLFSSVSPPRIRYLVQK